MAGPWEAYAPVAAPATDGPWSAYGQKQQAPSDPMEVAKAKLAEGLRSGQNGDAETYRTAAFRTNQGVPAAGITDAAINGATLGFGDEISAAARAPIDMALRGEGYNEAYQHNLAAERDRLDQFRKANPIKAGAAELAGSLVVPVGQAGAIRTGATTGALYGAGNSDGDITQRASDAGIGGIAGGAVGAVAGGIARAVGGKAPSSAPSIAELKAAAKDGYKSEAIKSLEVSPKAISEAATGVRAKLDAEGFDEVIGTKAHAILKRLDNVPEGATITGQNLHSLQKALGKATKSIDPEEKAAASMALREFNNVLENLPSQAVRKGNVDDFTSIMREANANYAAASNSGRIDQKLVAAEIRAAASNSGMNVSNTIRQRMADIIANPKQQRGLSAEDIATARQIAEGTTGQNLLRKAGNMMGGGGGIGAALTGGGGYAIAGPAGAAIPIAGMVIKAIGNKMTVNQAQKMSEAIRSRAPLASASQKFEEKVIQFQEARNAKTASAAALAARNLATNLRGSGFNVSTSDLMRALQAPAASRANDQPDVPRPPGQ